MFDRSKERLQLVKVFLQDRVEFMVMAAGTADAEAQEDASHRGSDIVEVILPTLGADHVVCFPGAQPVKTDGDFPCVAGAQFIAGDLVSNKGIEGLVFVEDANDVIAIPP